MVKLTWGRGPQRANFRSYTCSSSCCGNQLFWLHEVKVGEISIVQRLSQTCHDSKENMGQIISPFSILFKHNFEFLYLKINQNLYTCALLRIKWFRIHLGATDSPFIRTSFKSDSSGPSFDWILIFTKFSVSSLSLDE